MGGDRVQWPVLRSSACGTLKNLASKVTARNIARRGALVYCSMMLTSALVTTAGMVLCCDRSSDLAIPCDGLVRVRL